MTDPLMWPVGRDLQRRNAVEGLLYEIIRIKFGRTVAKEMRHRIMFVLPRMVSGGVERVSLNLMRGLLASDVDCTLALRKAHGEMLGEAAELVEVRELAPNGMAQFVPALATYVREWQPTHVVTAFADVGLLTLWALRRAKSSARLVHGVHDSHGAEVAKPGAKGWLRHLATNLMAGAVYRRASAIVTVSEGVRDELLARFPVDPCRVRTIYNPVIEASNLVDRQRPSLSNPIRLVALGRLARQKGFDILVEALAGLEVARPWRLDIYGDGPDRPDLEKAIHNFGLVDRVVLNGYTPAPMDALRASDIFILPSRHEGLPTVLIEALACQAQIIAADCRHGPREILQDERLGQLVPVEDPAALRLALRVVMDGELVIDPHELRRRAEDFTVAASLEKWLALLAGKEWPDEH